MRSKQFQFKANEWAALPAADRLSHCRLLAVEAHQLAATAKPGSKEAYEDLALHWSCLAEEIERELLNGPLKL